MQGEGYFCNEPLVTNRSYIGWGIVNGLCKIITKPHPRISIDDNEEVIYV